MHALWSCPKLDVMWADRGIWNFKFEVKFMDVKELLSWLFTYIAWLVWNQRNKTQLHLQAVLLHLVAKRAQEMLA